MTDQIEIIKQEILTCLLKQKIKICGYLVTDSLKLNAMVAELSDLSKYICILSLLIVIPIAITIDIKFHSQHLIHICVMKNK